MSYPDPLLSNKDFVPLTTSAIVRLVKLDIS